MPATAILALIVVVVVIVSVYVMGYSAGEAAALEERDEEDYIDHDIDES